MRTKFVTTGRIVVAAVAGTLQFFLVTGGVIYWRNSFVDYLPDSALAHETGKFIFMGAGLASLLWPMYVFGAAKRSYDSPPMDSNQVSK